MTAFMPMLKWPVKWAYGTRQLFRNTELPKIQAKFGTIIFRSGLLE